METPQSPWWHRILFFVLVAAALLWMGSWVSWSMVALAFGEDPCVVTPCSDQVHLGAGLLLGFNVLWMALSVIAWTSPRWRIRGLLLAFALPLVTWYLILWTLLSPYWGGGWWRLWWWPLPLA